MQCILSERCRIYKSAECNRICPSYVALHSASGRHTLATLPAEYRYVTVANSPVRSEQSKAYRLIDGYVDSFKRQFDAEELRDKPIKSLYLYSPSPGTGKTTTASAILNEWLAVHYVGSVIRDWQAHNRPAYFLDVNEWQTLFNGFNRSNIPREVAEPKANEYYRMMERAKNTPFVVMDDIGVRDATEAFRGDLHDVINHRVVNGLPTVFTSNIEITELQDVFDKRLYDRVRDRCIAVEFEGTSKRGVRR